MKYKMAEGLVPLLAKVRTDARGVRMQEGKPFKEDHPLNFDALVDHVNGDVAFGAYLIKPGVTSRGDSDCLAQAVRG